MKIVIDGRQIEAVSGSTILQAAHANDIYIPTLCHLAGSAALGACRVCVVDVKGLPRPVAACATEIREGMEITTDSPLLRSDRRTALELICSNHSMDCTDCPRGYSCRLRELCKEYGVNDRSFGAGRREKKYDRSTAWLVRDNSRCILCRRCETVCRDFIGISAIAAGKRAGNTEIGFTLPLNESGCVGCGLCASVCPTGALIERDDSKRAWKAIFDKSTYTAAIVSPNAYRSVASFFGNKGGNVKGKLNTMLRNIGFDAVYGTETIKAVQWTEEIMDKALRHPLLAGDCPAWRRYAEAALPDCEFISLPDRAEILARKLKAGGAERNMFIVSIDNCIAKKDISDADGVDLNLTTRELYGMIRRACVSGFTADAVWRSIEVATADISREAEAPALLPKISETNIEYKGTALKIAEISGLADAKAAAESGRYDILKVKACVGGCINGGGGSSVGGDIPYLSVKEVVSILNELPAQKICTIN